MAQKKTKKNQRSGKKVTKKRQSTGIPKEIIIVIIVICISLIAVFGTTYALFTTTSTGTKNQKVITGSFSATFTEGNVIKLTKAYPISDAKGLENDPYTFSIKNDSAFPATYRVTFEETGNTSYDNKIKFAYKKNNGSYSTPQLMSSIKINNVLTLVVDQELEKGKTDSFELKFWVDQAAGNEMQGKEIKYKVVVETVPKLYVEAVEPPAECFDSISQYACYVGNPYGLPELTSIIYPLNLGGSSGCYTFSSGKGKGIKNLVIPEGITYLSGLLSGALSDITTITIPSTVTTLQYKAIDKSATTNPNLTRIINKTGRSFDWTDVTGATGTNTFVTGTITHPNGNIVVTAD